jgi:hypothetical protein
MKTSQSIYNEANCAQYVASNESVDSFNHILQCYQSSGTCLENNVELDATRMQPKVWKIASKYLFFAELELDRRLST